jgi:hypothetical protein
MKKIIFALLCIAAICASASGQKYRLLSSTGYPGATPCPTGSKCRPPLLTGKRHKAFSRPEGGQSELVTITDAEGRSVDPASPPNNGKLYHLDFQIPIEKLKGNCGELKPGNFLVGYGFQDFNESTGFPEPGRSNGKLQSFSALIVDGKGHELYDGMLLSARSEQKVSAKRYTLPKEAARFLNPRNTLVLRATGFENIHVGLWCSAAQ